MPLPSIICLSNDDNFPRKLASWWLNADASSKEKRSLIEFKSVHFANWQSKQDKH